MNFLSVELLTEALQYDSHYLVTWMIILNLLKWLPEQSISLQHLPDSTSARLD